MEAAKFSKLIVTAEEHSVIGGLGGAVSEFLSEHYPTHVLRIGTRDTFGCSGPPDELIKLFGLTPEDIVNAIDGFFRKVPS